MSDAYSHFDFSGKSVLVSGAASGIGREVARAFHLSGAKVLATDVDGSGLESLASELGTPCQSLVTDVTNEAQVESAVKAVVKKFGRLDVCLNCAGAGGSQPLLEMEESFWDWNVDLNLKGFFLCIKHQGRQFRKQGGGGVIVNITSVTATINAAGLTPYAAAKAGANKLTEMAADELRHLGIRVVAIAPGLIKTPATEKINNTPEIMNEFKISIPSGRIGETSEIAHTALFLASDGAAYINGTIVHVDGGLGIYGVQPDLSNVREYYRSRGSKDS